MTENTMEPTSVTELTLEQKYLYTLRHVMQQCMKQNICEVTFQKADGTKRVMECTLINEMLPPTKAELGEETKPRAKNPKNLPVLETKTNEWRSFNLDTILDFKIINNE
jgi:hypothetical protein